MHHQACRKLAPGLVACGHASGDLIEAVEKPDYPFFLGVQWHPEYLWEQDPAIRQIFEAFVKAARFYPNSSGSASKKISFQARFNCFS